MKLKIWWKLKKNKNKISQKKGSTEKKGVESIQELQNLSYKNSIRSKDRRKSITKRIIKVKFPEPNAPLIRRGKQEKM